MTFDLKSSKTSFPSYNCVLETIIMKTDLKISNEEPEPCDHYGVGLVLLWHKNDDNEDDHNDVNNDRNCKWQWRWWR